MKRPLLVIVLLVLVAKVAFAALSFPALTGRVVDEAGTLSGAARAQLEQTLAAHEQATADQIVVVTLKSLQGDSIEDYGYQLGRFWGIGQKSKDNGVLLIVAPNERKVRIEVGYGLEPTLTDAMSSHIIQTVILPDFRAGQMERGVVDGADAIIATLKGQATSTEISGANPTPSTKQKIGYGITVIFFVLLLLIFLRIFLWYLADPTPSGRGGTYLGSGSGFGGGFLGGGFSGGGGSFGGGGASGGW